MGPIPSLTFYIHKIDQEFLSFQLNDRILRLKRLKSIILTRFPATVKMSPVVACARVGSFFLWRLLF